MKNNLALFLFACLITITLTAQQDAVYSQYLFNGLAVNPAYAGSKTYLSTAAFFRQQWVKIEGAPKTISLSAHAPFRQKNGWGVSLENDRIGLVNQTRISLDYAYSIPCRIGRLGMGLRGSVLHYMGVFSQAHLIQENDQAFSNNINIWRPNFGFGIYLNNEKYFAGLSVPHLLNTKLANDEIDISAARESRHYYLTTGYVFSLSPALKLRPSLLARYVANAPVQADISTSLICYDMLSIGAGYRTNSNVYATAMVQINKKFRMGYSFDYATTALHKYTSGTHEIILGYDKIREVNRVVTPRFF